MPIPLSDDIPELLDAPSYVHLSTLRADGSPRNWVVWVGSDGDYVIACASESVEGQGHASHPGIGCPSPTRTTRTAWSRSRVGSSTYVGPDEGCRHMDLISAKYMNVPFRAARPIVCAS
jgi:hypothetical protein